MSRLNDLLRQIRMENPSLADDLRREYDALADRRSFGLNFERHVPEAVELPGRKVRKGDKVRVLPPRGEARTRAHDRLWQVVATATQVGGLRSAQLISLDDANDESSAVVDDLVVVAEFRDPIYPGLVSTGKIERGGDKPYHAVVNAENFHALQTLLFTHRGKVDCIYIDPPYNTGSKDWKYNNDYVEGDDLYRHSKWLAFMERRLQLANELLNPEDSVLIVTIDEKEYLRLGMLLEQVFPSARIQMVSSVIKPGGVSRAGYFGRSDEYIFFVMLGTATPAPRRDLDGWGFRAASNQAKSKDPLYWNTLWRSGSNARRQDRPDLFYPIMTNSEGRVVRVGTPLARGASRTDADLRLEEGELAVWPIRNDGSEGRWQLGPETVMQRVSRGFVKSGKIAGESTRLYYLATGEVGKIDSGEIAIAGYRRDGSVIAEPQTPGRSAVPTSQWNVLSHDATRHGTQLLVRLLPDRQFPYPKSLYAVEDTLRFFVGDKPDAMVVDFFAGSGTTTHAVMRLNGQDGGRRRSISITNNEVGVDQQKTLTKRGLRPGDPEWEAFGICDHITRARIDAAVTGRTPDGEPVEGNYKFTSESPMADGLQENVEFFKLTYEALLHVHSNRPFNMIAALLWLRAGSRGRRIMDVSRGWDVADTYGVITDLDRTEPFLMTIAQNDDVTMAFIVTDEDRLFESLVAELPDHVEPVRLYEAYLRNFQIEAGRGTR